MKPKEHKCILQVRLPITNRRRTGLFLLNGNYPNKQVAVRHKNKRHTQALQNPSVDYAGLSIDHIKNIPYFRHLTEEEAMRICILLRLIAVALVSTQNHQHITEPLVGIMTISELKEIIVQSINEALPPPIVIPKEDRLLRRKDVASMFDVSLVSINEWMRSGRIPFHRMNSRVYFKESEVMEALIGVAITQSNSKKRYKK